MIEYRGVQINLKEFNQFNEDGYVVSNDKGMVFRAASNYGVSYASTPGEAVDGAKSMIDNKIGYSDRPTT